MTFQAEETKVTAERTFEAASDTARREVSFLEGSLFIISFLDRAIQYQSKSLYRIFTGGA